MEIPPLNQASPRPRVKRGRKPRKPSDAAKAAALSDLGYNATQIAEITQIPANSIRNILRGRGGWQELLGDEDFAARRQEEKRRFQAASMEIAKCALEQTFIKLPEASALQAATVYGILRDKERLDAGEATQHIAVATIEAASLERALDRLVAVERAINITPIPPDPDLIEIAA